MRERVKDCPFGYLLLTNSFIHISLALYSPFLNAYYRQNGAGSLQIGFLGMISCISAILIQPLWARRADESGKAKSYAALAVLGTALSLLTYYAGNTFGKFLFSAILLSVFATSVSPMVDAIVIRNAARNGFDFARVRMGGTVGYAVAVLAIGGFLRNYPAAQFWMASLSYLILFCLLLCLPKREQQLPVVHISGGKGVLFHISRIFINKEIYFVLVFAFLFQTGASFFMSFLGVYTVEIGYGQAEIGLLSCISAVGEIPVLLVINRLIRKYGAPKLIALAAVLMGVRILAASGGTLFFFILSQLMHGMTYMVIHIGCTTYVAEHVREGKAAEGQSILYIVQTGIASVFGSVLGGKIIDMFGIQSAYRLFGCFVLASSILASVLFTNKVRD